MEIEYDLYDVFKEHLNKQQPLTEYELKQLKNKAYFNGEPIKVGDVVLFALLIIDSGETEELNMVIIILNESHFNLFECPNEYNFISRDGLPVLKLK